MNESNEQPAEEAGFCIPTRMLNDIYELSGNVDKHKGMILTVINDKGLPMVYHRADSVVTELALRKVIEEWEGQPASDDYDL